MWPVITHKNKELCNGEAHTEGRGRDNVTDRTDAQPCKYRQTCVIQFYLHLQGTLKVLELASHLITPHLLHFLSFSVLFPPHLPVPLSPLVPVIYYYLFVLLLYERWQMSTVSISAVKR